MPSTTAEVVIVSDDLRLENLRLIRAQWEAALLTGSFPVVEYWIRNRRIRRLDPTAALEWIDRRIEKLEGRGKSARNYARLGGLRRC